MEGGKKLLEKNYLIPLVIILLIIGVAWQLFSPNVPNDTGTARQVISDSESIRSELGRAGEGVADSQKSSDLIQQSNNAIEQSIIKVESSNKSSREQLGELKQILQDVQAGKGQGN